MSGRPTLREYEKAVRQVAPSTPPAERRAQLGYEIVRTSEPLPPIKRIYVPWSTDDEEDGA